MKKILILVPSISARGGISNYYAVLKSTFSNEVDVEYFVRGARTWPIRKGFFNEIKRAYYDLQLFKRRLLADDVALVQATTSLGLNSIIRDGLFLKAARNKKIKTITFFRGWDLREEQKIERYYLPLFRDLFFSCDKLIVLSAHVKNVLIKWGYKKEVIVETTLVDSYLLKDINEEFISLKFLPENSLKELNFLFFSRVEVKKGIYESIDFFKKTQDHYKDKINCNLVICGDGFELENIKKYVKKLQVRNVSVEGFTTGEKKIGTFKKAHVFLFPSYGEGMPNSVLEAMGFGLVVITTNVGGLQGVFIDNVNGILLKTHSAKEMFDRFIAIENKADLFSRIARSNYNYAQQNFISDKVAIRIESIFKSTIRESL